VVTISNLSRDLTILFIEHDMDTIFAIADRITFWTTGRCCGARDEVRKTRAVRSVYLGE